MDAQEQLQTDELPIRIEETNTTETTIVSETCGHCGYDRAKCTYHKFDGEHYYTCQHCGATRQERDETWTRATTAKDRLRDLREYAEIDGPVKKFGEYGPRGRFRHGHEVFGYTDGTSLLKVFEHGRRGTSVEQTNLTEDQLRGILDVLQRDQQWVTTYITENWHQMDQLELASKLLPDDWHVTEKEE